MNLSPLIEALNEFDEFAFLDTPLVADLQSGQFVALSHAVQRSLRHLQQFSGFLTSQKTQRLKTIFHRLYKRTSNANAMTVISVAARLLVKAAACGPSVTVQKSSCYP
jgi:hypothetical protein